MNYSWLGSVLVAQIGDPRGASELRELGLDLARSDRSGLSRSNRGGWHSRYLYEPGQEGTSQPLLELKRGLEGPVWEFLSKSGRSSKADSGAKLERSSRRLRVTALWANVHWPGDYNVEHQHAEEGSTGEEVPTISGVYYAAAGSQGHQDWARLQFPREAVEKDDGQRVEMFVNPEPGTVVLFPAVAPHEVAPLKSQTAVAGAEDALKERSDGVARVSFSFNLLTRELAAPLDAAASTGDLAEVTSLLLAGSDVHAVEASGFSALHHAAEAGHAAVVSALLLSGAEPYLATPGKSLPVHLAAAAGHAAVVEMLLSKVPGLVSTAGGVQGATLLHTAAVYGDTELMAKLLALRAVIQARQSDGSQPLHCAALNGHVQAVELLLAAGALAASSDHSGLQPLHEAARGGLLPVADALLAARADPLAVDSEGRPPLYWAAQGGHVELLDRLAAAGASLRIAEASPGVAGAGGRGEAMANYLAAALVGSGGDPQVKPSELAPLHAAAAAGHAKAAEWLLARGADARIAATSSLMQPIHLAALHGHVNLVKCLTAAGTPVGEAARGKILPLHLAALSGHLEVANELLAHRASPRSTATDGSSPLHLAAARGHSALAERLLAARAEVKASSRQKEQPLHRAAAAGHEKLVELLLQHRADLGARNKDGFSSADLLAAARALPAPPRGEL
ncbi:unnamed protein product [Polarella glacialis]|uniref:Uncharacterized protein n=2 Tax=Polarella glacialis TaxID=89957 RepID=A0A813LVK9_POLGL|nr:unnamed protein product [Polarella glacialis]